jgi:hypothetical protein
LEWDLDLLSFSESIFEIDDFLSTVSETGFSLGFASEALGASIFGGCPS